MKRISLLILAVLWTGMLTAQDSGIKFIKALSWAQVKEKAKQENKYIFVDAYTTWCLPCKVMTNEIFPQPQVGNFFNANFINVAVQFDVTKRDSEEIKRWYRDAKSLRDTYKVDSYPTYLFFNPQGDLVHSVLGGSEKAEDFISKSKLALDPATQYNMLKRQFEAGKRGEAFLDNLLKAALTARDHKFVQLVGNAYLLTQKNLLTKENLSIVKVATTASTDPGFQILRDHPEKADSIPGHFTSSERIRKIIFHELVFPHLRTNAKFTEYVMSGMIIYSGEVRQDVNWQAIKITLEAKYPDLATEVLLFGKIAHFEATSAWPDYIKAVDEYIPTLNGDPIANNRWISSYASTLLRTCDDAASLNSALAWSKKTLSIENQDWRMYFSSIYSKLLYKTGEKEKAISFMEDALKNGKDSQGTYAALIGKMKGGEKVW